MKRIDEVIKGVKCCRHGNCSKCPYAPGAERCTDDLHEDVLAALARLKREQPDSPHDNAESAASGSKSANAGGLVKLPITKEGA